MNSLQKSLLILLFLVGGSVACGSALAEACTYREAIMALERGNTVRGLALMRMANRDGDEQASRYLAMRDRQLEKTGSEKTEMAVSYLPQRSPLLSLNRVYPE